MTIRGLIYTLHFLDVESEKWWVVLLSSGPEDPATEKQKERLSRGETTLVTTSNMFLMVVHSWQ